MKDATIGIGAHWWRFPGAQIETDSWEGACRSDGKMLLRDDTGAVIEGIEVDEPEDNSEALPVPLPQERRRRELLLARLMLIAVEIILADDLLGLETAHDLSRELRHAYPELIGRVSLTD